MGALYSPRNGNMTPVDCDKLLYFKQPLKTNANRYTEKHWHTKMDD